MKKLEKLIVASHNPAKVKRYYQLLTKIAVRVFGLADLEIKEKPREDGQTAEANAEIKAKFYSQKCHLPVFAEDEALYVDFLPEDQQPGVHIRRIDGKTEVDDDELFAYWEKIINSVSRSKRTGHWHIAYTFLIPDKEAKTFAIDWPIVFFSPPSGIRIPGWPISSLAGPPEFGKPHSELTKKEKWFRSQKNHRLILAKFKELLAT
ncbi:MAG: hypothetical protein JW991_01855 [Candidatus Pacebacteria bacterium]|nr:hypothetical protein [Candidatus Paceibacterota bacterium]